ncbi:hypothetical protein [Nocardia sp. NPDC019395]|uniref:hypothetical protein n=1 Tax=Nocardia sp. NPDC019395 TaxID=3154686 RepID=UPI0033CF586E
MTQTERLAAVKADAHARGKEPFDLVRLEALCDTSDNGRKDPFTWRHRRFELIYYSHPAMVTIEDLAVHVLMQGWNGLKQAGPLDSSSSAV